MRRFIARLARPAARWRSIRAGSPGTAFRLEIASATRSRSKSQFSNQAKTGVPRMYVDKTTRIAGWPAIQLRDALRGFHGWPFALEGFAAALKASEAQAAQLVADLMTLGYLLQVDSQETEDRQWQCTEEGFRLADARTTKPYRRAVAEQHLAAFLERAREVNTSDQYLYRVKRVVLFGSMLTDQPLVGDVDLAVLLIPRADDTETQQVNEESII